MTDLSASYLDHRQAFNQTSAADELLSRVTNGLDQEKPPTPTPQFPVAPAPLAGRVAADIGVGVTEIPRAVVKGVRDAYQNTINLAGEVGDWVEKKLNTPVLTIGSDGVSLQSREEFDQGSITDLVTGKKPKKRLADLAVLPDINAPKTTTGNLVKGVTQFLVGFKGVNKLAEAAGVPNLAGAAGYSIQALKGAVANFAAFDPHQGRLSDLIQQYPALQNPVTEFMSSKPDDSAAEGRFKNAIEGLGMGLVTDGFFKSVKMLRDVASARSASKALDDGVKVAPEPRGAAPDAFTSLGDEADHNLVSINTPDIAPGQVGEPKIPEVKINFARIDTPDDIKTAIQQLADAAAPDINNAHRGTQTFEQIKLNASQQNAWDVLQQRRAGAPLNAEQSVAARQLWVSSADKVSELAQQASKAPSEENLFAFRKMLSVHAAIQKEVIAARTETARSLASWRIPVGSSTERLRDIESVLNMEGGPEVTRLLAERVGALSRAGLHQELDAVIEKGAAAKTVSAVQEAWINGLLSGPQTHVANTISNTAVMGLRMAERATGAKIASLLGSEDSIVAGEANAQWFGMVQGAKDMARYYTKTAQAVGEAGIDSLTQRQLVSPEAIQSPAESLRLSGPTKLEYTPSISSEAFGISSSGFLGRSADYMGMLIRTPGKAMQMEDELFKTMGYRMELNSQALRQATKEVNQGIIQPDAIKNRIAELIANPPENLHLAAVDSALYQTFTNAPGKLAQGLSRMTAQYPALKVLLPFVRTPANILKFTFERTPLAPFMSSFRADVAAGGARRDLALAQMAVGTTMMLAASDAALNGQVTGRGPVEKGQRQALQREGWQPYSVKLGDRWVAYNRLDPVGSLIGLAADTTETLQNAQHDALDDADTEKLAVAATVAFAGNIVNKTYLSGLSSFIAALNEPTISAETWAQRLAGSIVPSVMATAERVDDPTVREAYSMMDAIMARTPGLSKDLPARLDLWGDPIKNESGLGKPFDAFSPVYTTKPTPEPIDQEIQRLGANITMPSRNTNFNGVTINLTQYPKAYQRYVELAGNELKHPAWNMGAKDLLNSVVSGNHPLSAVYKLRSDGPDGGKDVFIRDILRQYRELARTQLLNEFPELDTEVSDKKAQQRSLKMPVLQ